MPMFVLDGSKVIYEQFMNEVDRIRQKSAHSQSSDYDFRNDAIESFLAGWLVFDHVICKTNDSVFHIEKELYEFDEVVNNVKIVFNDDYLIKRLIQDNYSILWFDLAVKAKTVQKDTSAAVKYQLISTNNAGSSTLVAEIKKYDFSKYMPSDSSCFVCTVVYTCTDEYYKIRDFRKFRDDVLSTSKVGLSIISLYYRIGPGIAKFIAKRPAVGKLVKSLYNLIHSLIDK